MTQWISHTGTTFPLIGNLNGRLGAQLFGDRLIIECGNSNQTKYDYCIYNFRSNQLTALDGLPGGLGGPLTSENKLAFFTINQSQWTSSIEQPLDGHLQATVYWIDLDGIG